MKILLATDGSDTARAAADRLGSIAEEFPGRWLEACASLARARVALAEGEVDDAVADSRGAVAAWADVGAHCAGTPVAALVPGPDEPPPDSPPLSRRAELNVSLLLFVAQAIKIVLVATVITLFYLLFGLLAVREDTLLQWTTAAELTRSDDWVRRVTLFDAELVFTRQLVLVSAFIGVVSGLQFAVQLVTDESYRAEFASEMTDEIREALAVRAVYHRRLVGEAVGA